MKNRYLKVEDESSDQVTEVERNNGKSYLFVKCKECGKTWNISKLQRVPKSGYICPHCWSKAQQKRRERPKKIAEMALKYLFIAIVGVLLYAHTAEAAEIERGYKAHGGECLFLLLPLWWLIIEVTAKDTETAIKQSLNKQINYMEVVKK